MNQASPEDSELVKQHNDQLRRLRQDLEDEVERSEELEAELKAIKRRQLSRCSACKGIGSRDHEGTGWACAACAGTGDGQAQYELNELRAEASAWRLALTSAHDAVARPGEHTTPKGMADCLVDAVLHARMDRDEVANEAKAAEEELQNLRFALRDIATNLLDAEERNVPDLLLLDKIAGVAKDGPMMRAQIDNLEEVLQNVCTIALLRPQDTMSPYDHAATAAAMALKRERDDLLRQVGNRVLVKERWFARYEQDDGESTQSQPFNTKQEAVNYSARWRGHHRIVHVTYWKRKKSK